jgi:pyruvate,water dikinase
VPDLLSEIRSLVSHEAPDLPTAISDYVRAYRLYAQLPRPTSHGGNILLAAARGELSLDDVLARIGHHAPAWDVATPTYAEAPELVRAAIARLRAVRADLPPAPPPSDAELDDDVFALAQWHVRRALLASTRALGLPDADAGWLAPDDLPTLDVERARAKAAAARAAAERARAWAMPVAVRDGAPLPEEDGEDLRGVGSGGAASGIVHRIADLGRAALVPPGTIAVVATVTPALALCLAGARGIVAGHGGVLDHGAAVARELGIPCVVGCLAAWRTLRDGDVVEIAGDEIRRLRTA